MPLHNREIAALFERLADLLEVEGANPFRVRAYRSAARTVGDHTRSMADLIAQGERLEDLPGVGKDLAKKIETVVSTGRLPLLEEVEARTPPALSELMKIEGLGPKKVKALFEQLQVNSIEDLRAVAQSGKIHSLRGFGQKTEEAILERVEAYKGAEKRFKLIDAESIAEPLVGYLRQHKDVGQVVVAGSYRRRKETVGDLDILITTRNPVPVMDYFVRFEEVAQVVSKGKTRSTVHLRGGMSVDLRVVPAVSYGAALHYFTGSKAHNIAVRKLGMEKGYKINEYGVFEGSERIGGKTEKNLYRKVGLPYIEPELREARGELEAARSHSLPKLVTIEDIRGDLHSHTKLTDGHNSLEQMAQAARSRGYQYLANTEHSQRIAMSHGLDEKRLFAQIKAIDKLNEKLHGIVILKSVEVDILEDGSLDLPDRVLKELDLAVCSVHYKFGLSRGKQTERILRAMDNPHFNIFGHPTGRLLNEREAYDVDLEKLMEAARERGCCFEVNGQPDRMDLSDDACKLAKEVGVKVAISTDAHSIDNLDFMRFGVGQARRGWLEAADVINTLPLARLRKVLRRK